MFKKEPVSTPPKSKKASVSRVIVEYDCGFPNNLFIRGKGGGLSWDKGQPLKNLTKTLDSTKESSKALEEEIIESIKRINEEGLVLKSKRDDQVKKVDAEVLKIYERLLHNKRDAVIVPIENRCCSGCHIMLTAQDENLVRKGERLVFCEHCSRIHYWQDSQELEGTVAETRQRRRRTTKA